MLQRQEFSTVLTVDLSGPQTREHAVRFAASQLGFAYRLLVWLIVLASDVRCLIVWSQNQRVL